MANQGRRQMARNRPLGDSQRRNQNKRRKVDSVPGDSHPQMPALEPTIQPVPEQHQTGAAVAGVRASVTSPNAGFARTANPVVTPNSDSNTQLAMAELNSFEKANDNKWKEQDINLRVRTRLVSVTKVCKFPFTLGNKATAERVMVLTVGRNDGDVLRLTHLQVPVTDIDISSDMLQKTHNLLET